MARLTITQAIEASPVGRTRMYSHYIKKGLITVSVNNSGNKYIDSSELFRVFPDIEAVNTVDGKKQTELNSPEQHEITQAVQAEQIKHLKEQLSDAKEREQEYKERERFYRDQIRLLEAPKKRSNPLVRWWHGLGEKE